MQIARRDNMQNVWVIHYLAWVNFLFFSLENWFESKDGNFIRSQDIPGHSEREEGIPEEGGKK